VPPLLLDEILTAHTDCATNAFSIGARHVDVDIARTAARPFAAQCVLNRIAPRRKMQLSSRRSSEDASVR
jgi:hypothetical protein